MSKPDWITYVPRRVYNAARRLEAACERCGGLSPELVAECRSDFRSTLAGRVLWHQVWRFLVEEHNVSVDYDILFVVVDDPAFDCIYSTTPEQLH